ncbi:MAG TPA: citrate lyase acyl carrier protein [Clostridia bacterium]|nr:citrate lyase acyl carrier protein [Clostridia bacterium]
MELIREAKAGTLESSDIFVTVEPADELIIRLDSPVKEQFGAAILDAVHDVLAKSGVRTGKIELADQGALDCTIRARLATALKRASQAAGDEQ